jgi:hypothetical protein
MTVTLDHGKLLVVYPELVVHYNDFGRGFVPARPAMVTSPAARTGTRVGQNESVRAGQLDDILEHPQRHQRAGGVMRLVEVEQAGRRADQARQRVKIMSPAVFVPALPSTHLGAGALRNLQR